MYIILYTYMHCTYLHCINILWLFSCPLSTVPKQPVLFKCLYTHMHIYTICRYICIFSCIYFSAFVFHRNSINDEGMELTVMVLEAKGLICPFNVESLDTFVRIYLVPDEAAAMQTKVSGFVKE